MPYRREFHGVVFPDPADRCLAHQTINAYEPVGDLDPVSEVPAEATRAGWEPTLSGQRIPLIWERVTPDAEPGDCL